MRRETLVTNHTADAAIGAYRIVKHGAADGAVAQASASTEKLIGVANRLGAAAANDRVDVVRAGIAEVEFGASITRGDLLTADANGKAVVASELGIEQTIIGGGAAGDHTVTGIATTDKLLSVIHLDMTDASETGADLTAEFSISAANTINNAGGTNTTGGFLLVTYRRPVHTIGLAEVSGASGDIGSVLISPSYI